LEENGANAAGGNIVVLTDGLENVGSVINSREDVLNKVYRYNR